MRQRVLVLDGQSNAALACVRSLGRAGHTVSVASEYRRPLASWSRWCSHSVHVDGYTVSGFAGVRQWAERAGITVVLPMSEEACLLCNAGRQEWESLGVRVGCAPDELLLQAFDKAQTLRTALVQGVRIPPTSFPESPDQLAAAVETAGLPCVVKPRFSTPWDGRRFLPPAGVAVVHDRVELARAVEARRDGNSWPLVQSLMGGAPRTAAALYDRGQPVAWFAMDELRVVRPLASPSSLRRSVPLDSRLREPAERLLSALRWHGPASVDFLDDGVTAPCLMEVNGRFWNSLELAVAAGADFPAWWVRILCAEPLPSSREFAPGVTVRWVWGDTKRLLGTLLRRPDGASRDGASRDGAPTTREAFRDLLGRQPAGTRAEMWQTDDPWPAVGEWIEAGRDLRREVQRRFRVPRRPRSGGGAHAF